MKRINCILLCILFLIFAIPNAYAINTYVNGNNTIYPENTVKVSVGVSGAPLLYGFTGKINYNNSKLTLKGSSGLSGFSILLGENLTADSASGKSGSFSFLQLEFVPTSKFKTGEKTTISFNNVETSDGNNTLSCSNSSLTITMKAPKSKNAFLSSLNVDKGDILFDKNKDAYSIVVDNEVTGITIKAQSEDKNSKVSGVGFKSLNVYENVFNIVVTAESGDKKTYTIIATRKDKDGKTTKQKVVKEKPVLDNIKIDNYDLDFKKDIYEYSIKLKDSDNKLNVIPDYDKEKYTCEVKMPDEFIAGENLIKIILKDKDNNSIEYSIIVFKNEVVEDEKQEEEKQGQEKCKCKSTPCKYKFIFYFENIILVFILLLLLILKLCKKKRRENSIEII